ncbi:hypothetical protein BDR26DRAFT_941273 [Obelidium mucronatum]|nr:hypothetical protein BDR26DRAFT_941273 [Obelidium mucronatum]
MSENNEHDGIVRPPNMTSIRIVSFHDDLENIVDYLKKTGHGTAFDTEVKVPIVPKFPTDYREEVEPGPKPRLRENLKEGDDLSDEKGKIIDDATVYRKAETKWKEKLKLWNETCSTFSKEESLAFAQQKLRADLLAGQEKACGQLSTFFDKHKWKLIRDHKEFIRNKTVYKAVEVIKELFGGMDNSGLQFTNWDTEIRNKVIHGEKRHQLVAWRGLVDGVKKCISASTVLNSRFNAIIPKGKRLVLLDSAELIEVAEPEEVKLGELAVPVLVLETVVSVILKSMPESTNTSQLAGRLQPLRTKLETDGTTAFESATELIDDLTKLLTFTEINGEGGRQGDGKEKAAKALERKRKRDDKEKKESPQREEKRAKMECALCPEKDNHT